MIVVKATKYGSEVNTNNPKLNMNNAKLLDMAYFALVRASLY